MQNNIIRLKILSEKQARFVIKHNLRYFLHVNAYHLPEGYIFYVHKTQFKLKIQKFVNGHKEILYVSIWNEYNYTWNA